VVPPELAELARADVETAIGRLVPAGAGRIDLPPMPPVELPALPSVPALSMPVPPELPDVRLPSLLAIEETSVTGAPRRLNTFDQNVPGFSVTFLLLGMLLGVSLGLLDERDWGTLERLRAMPTPFATMLVAKLVARFCIGVVQMTILFAVGWLAFGVSLGPQPWALLLPTAGIVFAGTAFGLIVAGLAHSREAVLPVGSVVIVTMAAVGGCWWPLDLEPEWMRRVALGFPTTWAMAAFNDLMIRRQPVAAVLRPTAILFVYGAAYLAIGLALFRRQLDATG
jgi:ABC-2 type transport system permease protein